jgi:bifunctional DNase/RNase
MKEVEFRIKGLMMDPLTNAPIVVLQEAAGDALLPIWVGIFEANAIALQIEKVDMPRPMTHDLLKAVLDHLDIEVTRVVVSELRDNTFYAIIFLRTGDRTIMIDSRPSDAIAIALRTDSPIFITDEVLTKSQRPDAPASPLEQRATEDIKKWLENLNPDDLGKYKM